MAASSNGPRYAPEDPTLPKPWRGLIDGKTGYLYFWNPETNVTQYERPVAKHPSEKLPPPPPPKSSMPVSSSIHVQHSSVSSRHGQHRDSKEEDGRDAGSRGHHHYQSQRGASSLHSQSQPNGVASDHGASHGYGYGPTSQSSRSFTKQGPLDMGGLSIEQYKRQHEITVLGDNVPAPYTTFESAGFPSEILREVLHAGFSAPTPIQAQAWPIAMQNRDLIAIAKTGSGKTLGYLFPGFMHLSNLRNNPKMGPTVLVLAPTRELATQILDEAVKFGRSSKISSTCLYGGAPKGPQLRDVDRGVEIVVATPGRLNDILEMRRISLKQVSYLVLDEADRMLDMGFEPQIRKIVKEIPSRRQTLMFTATWPKEVRKIAADLLVKPVQVNIGNIDELVANKSITQYVEVIQPIEKQRRLEQILRSQEPGAKVLIFCSTKRMCDQLARSMTRQFGAAAIHGDKSQHERDHVLTQFRSGRSPILVATDVAARGLDIKDVRVVINYDFPTGIEDYVHRIGRTGRAGATGVSYTFFSDQDSKHASDLVKVLEGACQRVPREIRDMSLRGGRRGKFRRWAASTGDRDVGYSNDSKASGYGHGMESSVGRSECDRGGRGQSDRDRNYQYVPSDSRGRDSKIVASGMNDRREGDRDSGHVRSRSPVANRGHGANSWRSRSRSRDRHRSPARRSRSRGRHGAGCRSRSRSRDHRRSPARRSRSRSHSRSRQVVADNSRSRSRSRDRGRNTEQRSHSFSPSRGHKHVVGASNGDRLPKDAVAVTRGLPSPDVRTCEYKDVLHQHVENIHSFRSVPDLHEQPVYSIDNGSYHVSGYDRSATPVQDKPLSPQHHQSPSPENRPQSLSLYHSPNSSDKPQYSLFHNSTNPKDGSQSPTHHQSPSLRNRSQSPADHQSSLIPSDGLQCHHPLDNQASRPCEDQRLSHTPPRENVWEEPVEEFVKEHATLPIQTDLYHQPSEGAVNSHLHRSSQVISDSLQESVKEHIRSPMPMDLSHQTIDGTVNSYPHPNQVGFSDCLHEPVKEHTRSPMPVDLSNQDVECAVDSYPYPNQGEGMLTADEGMIHMQE